MKLIIDTQDEGFATTYIPEVLNDYVIKYYRAAKSKKLNEYLRDYNVKSNVRALLIDAVHSLKASKENNTYVLEVDKNRVILGTPFNLDIIVKLITYGTVDIRGYDLLLKAFEFVSKKLKTLKKMYAVKNKEKGE